jgi:hypothetical protein
MPIRHWQPWKLWLLFGRHSQAGYFGSNEQQRSLFSDAKETAWSGRRELAEQNAERRKVMRKILTTFSDRKKKTRSFFEISRQKM